MNKSIKKSKRLKAAAKAKRADSRRLGLLKKIKIREEQGYLANKEIKIPISFAIPIRIMNSASAVRRYAKKQKRAVFGKNPTVKIVSIFLIITLNWFGLKSIGNTTAYFSDTEASAENTFAAAKLDFSLNFLMFDGFRTQTQGGWGAEAHGNNPGAYRDDHFGDAFVDGLTIGGEASGYYAHFATSEDIEKFLPAGGTADHFSGPHENPTDTEAGILAGQTAALALNIGFDNSDPDFSANEGKLADFYANAAGSPCENMTAGEVLNEANLILSGKSSDFTLSEISGCAAEINERFDNGERTKITPSKYTEREIAINKFEGLNFRHILKIEEMPGNAELCSALTVKAYLNGTQVYSGNLLSFNYEPSVFSESANKWRLQIGLPEDAPSSAKNSTCGLKYIVSGWQENIVNLGEGFSDTEEVFDSVDSGEWASSVEEDSDNEDEDRDSKIIVINEFLPNPEGEEYGFDFGTDDSDMPRGEWIELYNNGKTGYDLTGWYFKDLAGNMIKIKSTNSLPASLIIPPKDWLVVYMNKATLNNIGSETITLYDKYNNIADSYSYSGNDYCDLKPTKGNVNNQTPSGLCSGVPGNKSYARIPDGTGAWVDPIPTPGKTNVVPENIDSASAIPEETVLDSGVGDNAGVPAEEGLSANGGEILNIIQENSFNLFSCASADDTGVCAADNNASSGAIPDSNTADIAIGATVDGVVSGVDADSSITNDTVNDAINNQVDSTTVDNSVDSVAGAGAEDISADTNSASNNVDSAGADSNEPVKGTESMPEVIDVSPSATAGEQALPNNEDNSNPYTDVSMEIRQENPPAVEEEPLVIEEPSVNEEPMPQSSDTSISANDNSNNTQSDAVQN